jgi:hypothetical protein
MPTEDPTIYINITQNIVKMMLQRVENWFVMVNVPHNKSESIQYTHQLLERMLLTKLI